MSSRFTATLLLLTCLPASSQPPRGLAPLFNRIWQVTRTKPPAAPGSLYVFLPNGTLLMTSCGETYRVALWSRDPKLPNTIRLTEDGQLSATLTVQNFNGATVRLTRTLVRTGEKTTLTLAALDKEFVCPDLPR